MNTFVRLFIGRALPGVVVGVLGVLALVAAGCSATHTGLLDPRTAKFDAPQFNAPTPQKVQLASGPTAYLLESHDIPLVRVYLFFKGGSVHDPVGKSGLASITSRAWRSGGVGSMGPEEFDDALEARAIHLGVSMGREKGRVSLSVLSKDLVTGLDMMAELIFAPLFDQSRVELAKAKKTDSITREDENPETLAFRRLRKAIYPGHPRGVSPTVESVAAVSRDDAVALHRKVVESSKWIVGAVGDFDADEMAKLLEKRFGGLKSASDEFKRLEPPPPIEPQVILLEKELEQTTMVWARFGPKLMEEDQEPLAVANFILGGSGLQSTLARKVRGERGLAYSVGSFYSPYREFGVLGSYASTSTATIGEAWTIMNEQMALAGHERVAPELVERAKATLLNQNIFRFRDPADIVTEMMGLELDELPTDLIEQSFRRISKVTESELESAASKVFKPRTGVWVLVGDFTDLPDDFASGWKIVREKAGGEAK